VRNHANNPEFLGAKMEAPVAPLGKARPLALPLCEQPVQGYFPARKHAQVSVHGEDVLIFIEGMGHPYGEGFLAKPAKPLGKFSLTEEDQHLFLDHTGL
jgi:hypothetical protein